MKGGKVKRIKPGKGKKWKKGHSSDCNPQNRVHRDAAKNKYFSIQTGPSDLTLDALAKHDAKTSSLPGQDEESSMDTRTTASFGAKTFKTWATNWTDCTNATFGKVHRHWGSNNAMQKEVLAVLAAITEVIKEQGGKECDTEYFAALMTMLEGMEEEISIAAALYLLSLSIKRTPVTVLRKSFSSATKMLLDYLGTYANSDNTTLMKSSLQCIAGLLRVQDKEAWSNSTTMQVYRALLAFTTHAKPRVRKEAQHAVRVVLKTPAFIQSDPSSHHPAAAVTATYCVQEIEKKGADANTTLHLLGLLQHLLGTFPQNSLKSACETVLRAMTLANVVVTSVALRTLHGLFISSPSASSLPPQLNAQIITALYDFQPGEQDTQPMAAWMRVMEAAHVNLAKIDEELCVRKLPEMFESCMKCLLRADSAKSAAATLNALITTCLPLSRQRIATMACQSAKSPVRHMLQHLEGGLSYQYHAVWGAVLTNITAFFKTVGSEVSPLCRKLILSMSDLRDSMNFPYRGEVEQAVGAAVATMGPKVVLDAVPLQITGDEESDNREFPRSWLIPVIRDNVTHTHLAFFISYFLPLAAKLRKKALEYEYEGQNVLAKSYDALQNQIWSMLPGFCTHPKDVPQSFKGIAKILGETLNNRVDLRLTVLNALRKLIQHSMEDDACKAEMCRFSKNYLPILFNLYTTQTEVERDPKRMAVLETAKVYFQITDKKLTKTLYEDCVGKLSSEEEMTAFRRHALMDLVILLLPYIDLAALQRLYPLVMVSLTNPDKTTQKKSYRILEEICSSSSTACKSMVTSKLSDLQTHLTSSLSSSSPSARAPRLRCLAHILDILDHSEESVAFLQALVPEAILCTKELAQKARQAAFALLTKTGTTLARWNGGSVSDVQKEMFELFLAGLGGDAHMVSCTVLALTKLIFDFRNDLDVEMVRQLVDATCLLLRSKAREVVVAAVGLLKLLVSITPESNLAQSLPDIVGSLVAMKAENKHNLRFRNKEIYARLIRKFGYEVILKLVPQSHHRILINIKKTQERKERKKKEEKEDSDDDADTMAKARPETIDDLLHESDSEMEEEEEKKTMVKEGKKKGRGKAWIKEGADEEDIVDFLDPSVNQRVMATKPSEKGKESKKIKHDFKTASDGRLIITEDSDEEEEDKPGKKGNMDDEDDLEDLLDAMGGHKKSKKRKVEDMVDDDDDETAAKSGYKPGGTGIHRPLGKRKADDGGGSEYRAKKAKGDVKKKGEHDPYAYIKLDTTTLNRRKKAKAKGQFSNLVKGAQKGASKGQKLKNKGKHQA